MAVRGRLLYNSADFHGPSDSQEVSDLSFEQILKELVAGIRGATGALLLEADGEAVAWHSADNAELLKLRGAYVAVMLRSCEMANRQFQTGAIEHLYVQYAGASFLAQQVGDGYFVVVELNSSANHAEVLYHIKPFAERVTRELRA